MTGKELLLVQMEQAAEQIAKVTAEVGITTEQAVETAEYISDLLNRMTPSDPAEASNAIANLLRKMTSQDLEHEIICITMNPSLSLWQKAFLIRKLKKRIKAIRDASRET